MGQKTLQTKPTAFDRINVRRLFLTLERATQRTLKYFVFEPNTEFTRTRLKSVITPIFEFAKNTEGLFDFEIVCDERINTPDVIDNNELLVSIYLKAVRSSEFILIDFIATRTSQNFQEII
jgi:phage tail sheath protein FI